MTEKKYPRDFKSLRKIIKKLKIAVNLERKRYVIAGINANRINRTPKIFKVMLSNSRL